MKETQVEIKRAPKPKLFQKKLQDFWVKTVNTHLTDAEKDINKKIIITGFNIQSAPKADKRNKQHSTPYLLRLQESDITILLETNCHTNQYIDVHDIKLQQTHNESAQMLGAGMAMIHHRNLEVNTYVKQLNNEKRIAKTVRLQNGQLFLIVGLHM